MIFANKGRLKHISVSDGLYLLILIDTATLFTQQHFLHQLHAPLPAAERAV